MMMYVWGCIAILIVRIIGIQVFRCAILYFVLKGRFLFWSAPIRFNFISRRLFWGVTAALTAYLGFVLIAVVPYRGQKREKTA
ncbi:hypothetical protein CBR_g17685 [Chara braunii]|uniref:Uncharacterized protein n=1 Tax=Chara braunii TaxID=69332 RepID=A0A388KVK5_CHABU|nr:hypothetical protein CBR_g17685 [Chara braunii]|eukprot:GBG73973.1 hypothetical protein CBR_g17685 [Chara braunii]